MAFDEKRAWLEGIVTACAYLVYVVIVLVRAHGMPLHETAYVVPMLGTIGGGIVATILTHVVVGIASREECDKRDVRDREIHRFGEYVGQSVLGIGGLAVLVLAMLEANHFWIANVVYLMFALAVVLGSVTKVIAYRRGFQSC